MKSTNESNVSIIVPTYKEAQNITDLVSRIAAINLSSRNFEVIIVDDNSADGTIEIVNTLHKKYPWLKLITRRNGPSLSLSVIEGYQAAQYSLIIIMDADLSHPPEKIPEMLELFNAHSPDLILGSRYILHGSVDKSWSTSRRFTSKIAALLVRVLLTPHIKDPLSGFLLVRKDDLMQQHLAPIGWKIGLEMMIKCQFKHIIEIPIHFSERYQGKSKFTIRTAWSFLSHVKKLCWYKWQLNRD